MRHKVYYNKYRGSPRGLITWSPPAAARCCWWLRDSNDLAGCLRRRPAQLHSQTRGKTFPLVCRDAQYARCNLRQRNNWRYNRRFCLLGETAYHFKAARRDRGYSMKGREKEEKKEKEKKNRETRNIPHLPRRYREQWRTSPWRWRSSSASLRYFARRRCRWQLTWRIAISGSLLLSKLPAWEKM